MFHESVVWPVNDFNNEQFLLSSRYFLKEMLSSRLSAITTPSSLKAPIIEIRGKFQNLLLFKSIFFAEAKSKLCHIRVIRLTSNLGKTFFHFACSRLLNFSQVLSKDSCASLFNVSSMIFSQHF